MSKNYFESKLKERVYVVLDTDKDKSLDCVLMPQLIIDVDSEKRELHFYSLFGFNRVGVKSEKDLTTIKCPVKISLNIIKFEEDTKISVSSFTSKEFLSVEEMKNINLKTLKEFSYIDSRQDFISDYRNMYSVLDRLVNQKVSSLHTNKVQFLDILNFISNLSAELNIDSNHILLNVDNRDDIITSSNYTNRYGVKVYNTILHKIDYYGEDKFLDLYLTNKVNKVEKHIFEDTNECEVIGTRYRFSRINDKILIDILKYEDYLISSSVVKFEEKILTRDDSDMGYDRYKKYYDDQPKEIQKINLEDFKHVFNSNEFYKKIEEPIYNEMSKFLDL